MVQLGILNSRMKDFYDIWLLSRQFDFDGKTLAEAIQKTFDNRDTKIPQQVLAFTDEFSQDRHKQTQWKAFIRKSKLPDVSEDLSEITAYIQEFLQAVINALVANQGFDKQWQAGQQWQ